MPHYVRVARDQLGTWLLGRLRAMSPSVPYRPPSPAERADGAAGLRALLGGAAPGALSGLGFEVVSGVDHTVVAGEAGTERAWGAVVLDGTGPPRRVVAVPHPVADRLTAWLGLELFRAAPGSALLMAGTHRRASGGAADVAHRTDSMFHVFAGVLAEHAPVEVQPHGYAAATLPDFDAVVSPGAAAYDPAHAELRDALLARGFRVRPEWTGLLDGSTNVQGAGGRRAGHGVPAPGAGARAAHRRGDPDQRSSTPWRIPGWAVIRWRGTGGLAACGRSARWSPVARTASGCREPFDVDVPWWADVGPVVAGLAERLGVAGHRAAAADRDRRRRCPGRPRHLSRRGRRATRPRALAGRRCLRGSPCAPTVALTVGHGRGSA